MCEKWESLFPPFPVRYFCLLWKIIVISCGGGATCVLKRNSFLWVYEMFFHIFFFEFEFNIYISVINYVLPFGIIYTRTRMNLIYKQI